MTYKLLKKKEREGGVWGATCSSELSSSITESTSFSNRSERTVCIDIYFYTFDGFTNVAIAATLHKPFPLSYRTAQPRCCYTLTFLFVTAFSQNKPLNLRAYFISFMLTVTLVTFSNCNRTRSPPDMESSCEYIEQGSRIQQTKIRS
jgi:hypothetical protein